MAKTLTDLGSISMVQLRIKMQPRFDNSSDTSDSAWAHVHAAFLKLVEDGTLPEHDRISVAALKRRWTLEYGEFKMWCATANRAVEQSGVPRDQVEELVKAHYRCTTTTFRRHVCRRSNPFEPRPQTPTPTPIPIPTFALALAISHAPPLPSCQPMCHHHP